MGVFISHVRNTCRMHYIWKLALMFVNFIWLYIYNKNHNFIDFHKYAYTHLWTLLTQCIQIEWRIRKPKIKHQMLYMHSRERPYLGILLSGAVYSIVNQRILVYSIMSLNTHANVHTHTSERIAVDCERLHINSANRNFLFRSWNPTIQNGIVTDVQNLTIITCFKNHPLYFFMKKWSRYCICVMAWTTPPKCFVLIDN